MSELLFSPDHFSGLYHARRLGIEPLHEKKHLNKSHSTNCRSLHLMRFRWRKISLQNWIIALVGPYSSIQLSHQLPSLAGCMGNHYVVSKSELLLRIKPVWKHELHYRLMQNESQWLHPWKSQLIQHLLYPVYLKLFLYPTHVRRNYTLRKVYQICQNLLT